jgi:hypothetical protein
VRKLVLENAAAGFKSDQGDDDLRRHGQEALNLLLPDISRASLSAEYAQIIEQALPMLREYFPPK